MLDRLVAGDRYRMLVLMSPDAISVVDEAGLILDCNDQFAQLHGYASAGEVLGRNAAEFLRAEEFDRLFRRVGAAIWRGEKVVRGIQVEVLRRDGSSCITEYSVAQVAWPDAPGGRAYLSSIRDVTAQVLSQRDLELHQARLEEEVQERTRNLQAEVAERARLEDILRQRVQELSSLQALGQTVSFAYPLEEIILVYLQRLIVLGRVKSAELYLRKGAMLERVGACSDAVAPAADLLDAGGTEGLAELAVQQRRPVLLSDSILAKGPDGCNGSVLALPLRTADATFGALVVTAPGNDPFAGRAPFLEMAADLLAARLHNVLLHGEMQDRAAGLEEAVIERTRELQTERDRNQAILETLGESVVVADREGVVLFANPATVSLTGYTRDELLGQPLWSQWTAQALAKTWPEARRAVLSGQAWHGEITGHRKDGTVYTAGLTGTPLYDLNPSGPPVGSVWVQRDVTLLKEAERLKDQFVSNVSHELRTPISIIALTCDNLEAFRDRLSERDRWQMVQEIHEQAHLLAGLAEDILRISQIDSGRVYAAKRPLDLSRIVGGEVDGQGPVAQKRSLNLSAEPAKPVYVMGNEIQLRQVIRNLIDNAIKFTPHGGRIICRCAMQDGEKMAPGNGQVAKSKSWAVVEIEDNGIGIAAGDLPLIFERFYRVRRETDIPGTGLGLPIAQELALQHGGWISVASTLNVGSIFSLFLPACESEVGQPGGQ